MENFNAVGSAQGNSAAKIPQGGNLEPQMILRVSSDRMQAFLQVKQAYSGQPVSTRQVMDFLKSKEILYGLREDSIRDFCENRKFFLELPCAKGTEPEEGKDGFLQYLFQRDKDMLPVEREDGSVDFRDLGTVQNVAKDEALCRITPPVPGKDGRDVYNNVLPYRRGKMPKFPEGKNTVISEDGLELRAAIGGIIEYKNAMLNISELFLVHGDVDSASGNITATGSVTVQGDVLEGFQVKATGDIIVRGMVEGARLEAGGSITISGGMNGMGRGRLTAKGNITGRYFENTTLSCDGDIYSESMLNCNAAAGGSIILRGRRATLAGGRSTAGVQIYSGIIGTAQNAKTEVLIVSQRLELAGGQKPEEIFAQAAKMRREIELIRQQIAALIRAAGSGELPRKARLWKKDAEETLRRQEAAAAQLEDALRRDAQTEKRPLEDYRVVAFRTAYAGTKIGIGPLTKILTEDYNCMKFQASKGEIAASALLPAERII